MSTASLPRPGRASVILYADIHTGRGPETSCRVRNLSVTGACIDNVADLHVGERVRVTMGVLAPVAAQVIWSKPHLAGLRFDGEVDLAAARTPRRAGHAVSAGWIGGLDDPYRRRV
ncbi:PilZ domain-containing protein [Sphingomonas corticis]|jgi:hypothetical protein|uniref:PilZ domain-containing protein n=1 Tax=Sphingomonas corticis TaxID=2722791 RepID=A0ABX1CM14_9SPHN|nr:PilZ domain-containing protein [Sphingomonas corticis]NJR79019.1 PilZ domain-containing protein [Sphingomonas corticis]